MPPALKQLLTETDALIAKAKGAVAVAAKDIQKEVLYLAGKLDIANSADNRELVYKAVEKRIATLGSKLNTLFQYADDHAVIKANEQAAKATGVQVKISKRHANEIINAVQKAGGENIAAVMTANMQGNVITALRDSVVSAMREQAMTGGSMKDLQATIKAKWEAAAKGADGLAFVDRAGKVWDTDTYLNMNVRTNAMRVYNDALVNQIGKATGGDLVMVSRGGDPNCKHCFPWEGRILSITGKTKGFPTYDEARRAGCFHPNCTHTLEPVDEELDADEINLQRQFKPPADLADREAMDDQRYEMDIARKMQNEGLDATAAKVAVDRDNLADSLRQGLVLDGAEDIVAGLTDEQVNALCPNGNPPEFLPPKWNGGEEAWNKGAAGGVLYAKGKTLTAEKLVDISGVGAGKQVEDYHTDFKPKTAEDKAAEKAQAEDAAKKAELAANAENIETRYAGLTQQVAAVVAESERIDGVYKGLVDGYTEALQKAFDLAKAKGKSEDWLKRVAEKPLAEITKYQGTFITSRKGWSGLADKAQALLDATAAPADKFYANRLDAEAQAAFNQSLDALEKEVGVVSHQQAGFDKKLDAEQYKGHIASLNKSVAELVEAALEAEKLATQGAKYERKTLDGLKAALEKEGLTADKLKALPLAKAIEVTAPLNDNFANAVAQQAQKLAEVQDKWNPQVEAERTQWSGRVREWSETQGLIDAYGSFGGWRVRSSSSGLEGAYKDKGKELTAEDYEQKKAAVLAFIEQNGLQDKYAKFVKKAEKDYKDYVVEAHFVNGEYKVDRIPYDDQRKRFRDLETTWLFLKNERHKESLAHKRRLAEIEDKRDFEQVEASPLWALGQGVGGCKVAGGEEVKVSESREGKWAATRKLLERFMPAETMPKQRLEVKALSGDRAYQSGHTINLSASDGVEIYLHEFAHWVEEYNPHIHQRCQEFLLYRAEKSGTTTTERLRDITRTRYKAGEVTLKDNFFSPYCGKVYGRGEFGYITSGGETPSVKDLGNGRKGYDINASELLSMGVQRIHENAEKFYKDDPEYFNFVVNTLQGVI